ncbi:hypothetical protein [Flavivirga spongiicola]|uniref:Carboxypeptidase regulatory-like domain-containing protein n=1 Tax=Flavivirga spongiicola TaxID=421621 RepID=A0ABU7XRM7_9FLAO|nr:hypothetical protein [Flavivirga sp. MEBiC05379]MDO5978078.1 hypothetical protein [Flavivirga sp. MEBiC05379]
MNRSEKHLFSTLKHAIAATFLKNYSAPEAIEDWKGDTITDFQEDLFSKVKAKVSEKWFYTYFKNDPEKLPRIDILNLLSVYVGCYNWEAFKSTHTNTKTPSKRGSLIKIVGLLMAALFLVFIFKVVAKNEFHFCFVDEDKGEPITNIALDIKLLQAQQSPLFFKTDSTGCFSYTTKSDKITFVVQSPYHKTDTIVRHIDANSNQTVRLTTDDYALMLDYYTNGNIKDWKKRKQQLQQLIADHAQIYQMFPNNIGIEIYSKDDFIRTLTIPTNSLKHIKILDKKYSHGKVVKLKFMIE